MVGLNPEYIEHTQQAHWITVPSQSDLGAPTCQLIDRVGGGAGLYQIMAVLYDCCNWSLCLRAAVGDDLLSHLPPDSPDSHTRVHVNSP